MENGKRSQITSFLLVVGIIFIVVSGTIFASNAWQYLPKSIRQCILLFLSLGLFTGSWKLSRNGRMEKTETALYYLGSSFLGLFALLVCGGVTKAGEWNQPADVYTGTAVYDVLSYVRSGLNSQAVLAASIVIFLTVVLRFFWKRSTFDFICMALSADFVVFWIMVCCSTGVFGSFILSAAGLSVYTAAYCLRKKWQNDSQKIELAFLMLYILHVTTFFIHCMLLEEIQDKLLFQAALWIMAFFMVINSALLYKTENKTVYRILNSLGILYWLIAGVYFIDRFLWTVYDTGRELWNTDMPLFLSFTLCALCMVVFMRMEMFIAIAVAGMCIPFWQLFTYGGYGFLFTTYSHRVSVYLPFSGILAVTSAALLWRWRRNGAVAGAELKRYAAMAVLQIPVMLTVFLASKYPFFHEGINILLAIGCCSVSLFFSNRTCRAVFQTFALFFMGRFVAVSTVSWIAENYQTEYACFWIAAGLFLLEKIWGMGSKQVLEGIRITQFVGACSIAFALLLHVFAAGEIGNGLILGITSVITLVAASVYNNRAYALLASVVLVLLAFYLTRSFWLSIAWWVYLFIAGVVLVVLAIRYEKK